MSNRSRPDDPTVVLVGTAAAAGIEFTVLDLACRFYGLRLELMPVPGEREEIVRTPGLNRPSPILVVWSASELAKASVAQRTALRTWAEAGDVPVAVVGITADCNGEALAAFAEGTNVNVTTLDPGCSLWVSAQEPDSVGFALRGIPHELGPGPVSGFQCADNPAVRVMATVGTTEDQGVPAMVQIRRGTRVRYLVARTATADASGDGGENLRRVSFGEVAPLFLLLREVGGDRCWAPPAAFANLTIDDPWLTEPYGSLSFAGLLAEMRRERFHATIGFVPWNFDRNSAKVVALFRENPDCLSVAVHGNNHDGYEFYLYENPPGDRRRAKPLSEQLFNLRQGLARMEAFRRVTGLEFDPVMVFPHGISPGPTLEGLKNAGYWATFNFSNVPWGERAPGDPADALRSVNTDCHGFPALSRSYPHEYPEAEIAVDLFLGNPVLFMAHQDNFIGGIDAFNSRARLVNRRWPATRWAGLGEVARQLYRRRWLADGHCEVRLDSRVAKIENPRPHAVEFHFAKREPEAARIQGVTVGGVETTWQFAEGEIQFAAQLPPGATVGVEIRYQPLGDAQPIDIRRRGFRHRCTRMISDFRDVGLARRPAGRALIRSYYALRKGRAKGGGRNPRRTAIFWAGPPGARGFRSALLSDVSQSFGKAHGIFSGPVVVDQPTTLILSHDFEVNYVIGFVRGLAANGVKLIVASSDDITQQLAAADIAQCNLRRGHWGTRAAWRKIINLIQYYFRLSREVFRHRGDPLHFIGLFNNRFILFEGLVFPVWFRLWAGRYIHTVHNVLPHDREKSRLFRSVYRWIYRFPHAFVAHTARVAQELESDFGVDPKRIKVISIGLNEEMPPTALSVAEARRQLGLPPDGPIALFFGKIEPYKGIDVLAEAWGMARTPGARLVIAGWCPYDTHTEQIRSYIARSAQAATMEWREGYVPNDEVAVWLKACDVVVMPYRHIYQSGVVFLCLRFGMPVVATNVGSLAEYIDADTGIIAASNDPAGIAEALDRFFATRTRFDRAAISRRAAKYGWARQCLAIKGLYR